MTADTGLATEVTLCDGRKVIVRTVGETDGALLKGFLQSLSAESWHFFAPHAYTDEVIAERIGKIVAGQDRAYIAVAGERAVAYCCLWGIRKAVPLLAIGVTDAWQGCRLGQQLLDVVIQDARALGKDGIELTTMLDNDRAFHIYQKKGFIYLGNVQTVEGGGEATIERRLFLPLKEGAQPPRWTIRNHPG